MADKCPLPIDWLDFVSGDDDADLRRHLDGCPSCREVVRLLRDAPRLAPSAASAITGRWKVRPLTPERGLRPQIGDVWLTKRRFSGRGYSYSDLPAAVVLISGIAGEALADLWLYAVAVSTGVDDALDGDLVLRPDESDMAAALRVPIARQVRLAASQLEGRAGRLTAAGTERLERALAGDLPMDHSGTPSEGTDDLRLDRPQEAAETLDLVAGYYWYVREELQSGAEQPTTERSSSLGVLKILARGRPSGRWALAAKTVDVGEVLQVELSAGALVLKGMLVYDMWAGDVLRLDVEEAQGFEASVAIVVISIRGAEVRSDPFLPSAGMSIEVARDQGLMLQQIDHLELRSP